jgi:uncharacterized membrane protein YcaP (DUF421 family)
MTPTSVLAFLALASLLALALFGDVAHRERRVLILVGLLLVAVVVGRLAIRYPWLREYLSG